MSTFNYNLGCYRVLRQQMRDFAYNMYPFYFNYNQETYFVAAYILTDKERVSLPQYAYALFHFIFMKRGNLDDVYELYMNSDGILEYNPTELKGYFGINSDPNGYGFMLRFCNALVEQCPQCTANITDEDLLHVEKHTLCKKLEIDPEHCYRLAIVRLPEPKLRNANRYQLAQIIFPHATELYAKAFDVTYRFTDNPDDEVDEDRAIERFTYNERHRKK